MSFIGSMFSNDKGAGFQGQGVNLTNPVTPEQLQQAQAQAQSGIDQQQQFVNALQGQNGLGKQNSVYDQMQGVASGTGPNPAQAMLNQATGANVANQAALMAGQRGSSANAGLMARQAAMQGANTQQQAAGQGATMQANQSLGALNQMGGMANQMATQQAQGLGTLNQVSQNQHQNLLNANQANQNANVNMQGNMNSTNAGIAGQNAKTQGDALGGLMKGAGAALPALGIPLYNGGQVPMRRYADGGGVNVEPASAPTAAPAVPSSSGGGSDPMAMIASLAPMLAYRGGQIPSQHLAAGGPVSAMGQYFQGNSGGVNVGQANASQANPWQAQETGMADMTPDKKATKPKAAPLEGTKTAGGPMDNPSTSPMATPVPVAPGVVPGLNDAMGSLASVDRLRSAKGGPVPGKAAVKGNSPKNDTVPAMLSPGEIVIPRSVLAKKDPAKEAAKFVAAVLAKHGKSMVGSK